MGDGSPALAAMLASKPCIAVALTQEHMDGVKSHLANAVFKGYYTEGSPFHDARIAKDGRTDKGGLT